MSSSRHLIDDKVWERIMFAAKAHGYSLKGKKSWQKFVLKLVEQSLLDSSESAQEFADRLSSLTPDE